MECNFRRRGKPKIKFGAATVLAERVAPLGKRVKVEKRNLEDNIREVGFVRKMYLPFQTDLEL